MQVLAPVPVAELRPRFPWLTYQEPEAHLPDLADRLAALPGIGPAATVGGLSYKDDSTLALLAERGLRGAWRIDPGADLGLGEGRAEIESIQERLTPAAAERVLRRTGGADLLLARHVVEHVDGMTAFVAALRTLLKPGGRLVVEVPDCARAFRLGDYTTLWEEHLISFTPATFRSFFPLRGFSLPEVLRYPYPFEDSLVAVARLDPAAATVPAGAGAGEAGEFAAFAAGLPGRRALVRARLAREVAAGGAVALLGAGHAAGTFLNLFGLGDLVSFVADDNPNKAGLFMPGSRVPILPSRALLERDVRLCLLAVGSSAEDRVLARNAGFLARGGRFASIYPASPLALNLGPAGGGGA